MSWFSDILKHIAPARSLVSVLFCTSLVAISGPRLWPSLFDFTVPLDLLWLIWMVAIISFFIIASWSFKPGFDFIRKLIRWAKWHPKRKPLTHTEEATLVIIGIKSPVEFFPVGKLATKNLDTLEALQLCRQLEKRGFITFLSRDIHDMVKLTPKGASLSFDLRRKLIDKDRV